MQNKICKKICKKIFMILITVSIWNGQAISNEYISEDSIVSDRGNLYAEELRSKEPTTFKYAFDLTEMYYKKCDTEMKLDYLKMEVNKPNNKELELLQKAKRTNDPDDYRKYYESMEKYKTKITCH
ncbi:MAG: hypothetical protein JHC31_08365 [Sulfurihydrogenibium sp.]|jgi:hypothetical protein|nr:hypothetical protein [Sulfurihydrogenibium sp.]